MDIIVRHKKSRRKFCDFCSEHLSERAGGASTVSMKQAYIDIYPKRINELAGSTVGLSIWLRTDEERRFIQFNHLWYLKEDLDEAKLSE